MGKFLNEDEEYILNKYGLRKYANSSFIDVNQQKQEQKHEEFVPFSFAKVKENEEIVQFKNQETSSKRLPKTIKKRVKNNRAQKARLRLF